MDSASQRQDPMCQTPIQAVDSIEIAAPPAAVWQVLADVRNYPAWWPRSVRVRLLTAGHGALGCELEVRPLGGRPFRCRVEDVRAGESMRMRYFGGFVAGHGEWRVEGHGQRTRVTYRLDVVAHGRLVKMIGKWISLPGLHSRLMRKVLLNLDQVVRERRWGQSANC